MGRRGITIQLPPSSLAEFIILTPVAIAANAAANHDMDH
jgi:hypothetical protein